MPRVPKALTIAGSDSGGGAGIQADLKTFAALGVYGTSVITAITAQNTLGVTGVQEIDTGIIQAQIDAVISDIGADAAKTGMLSSAAIIETVAAKARQHAIEKLVVDPVMVAASGARLLREDAVETLKRKLLPLALVATPNIPEAQVLVGAEIRTLDDMKEAAREIARLGPRNVIVKGGHRQANRAIDVLFDGKRFAEYSAEFVKTTNTHGTGCTFSSAITSGLAKGLPLQKAVAAAKAYVTEALRNAYPIGSGHGPLNHMFELWGKAEPGTGGE
ncbi:MAG: bifunctional hydroxymethylpyrimidine kinase/phosphomethylpyrimidine kinase [Chloroflexi bacterium]|nr:bifunctional hydroxymethylpyrimidine kinase/phosphomethylpyrimidine kinase [Chloroflexota bacterium]